MVNTDPADETKRNITIDGEESLEVETDGVSFRSTRVAGNYDVQIGPNGEWSFRYDDTNEKLNVLDSSGNVVAFFEDNEDTLDFQRVPLAPEYDNVSNAPQNPRGIVRFTSNSSKSQGLYSYSNAQSGWVQLDAI